MEQEANNDYPDEMDSQQDSVQNSSKGQNMATLQSIDIINTKIMPKANDPDHSIEHQENRAKLLQIRNQNI